MTDKNDVKCQESSLLSSSSQHFQVSKSNFQDYCCQHLGSLSSLSSDQMRSNNFSDKINSNIFCDKKLVAINHLYNDDAVDEAILSVRGTVRGIKNRVRAGIQTFAQEKVGEHRNIQNYKTKKFAAYLWIRVWTMCDVHDNTGNSEEHQDKMFKCQEDLEKLVSQVTLTLQICTLRDNSNKEGVIYY